MTNVADHRAVLKRVAVVLVLYALVEGAVFAYCVARQINFASSIGMIGLLAAFYLWRGSLRAAAVVRWGALFFAAMAAPSLVLWPTVVPPDLFAAACRFRTADALFVGGYMATTFGLLIWAAREMGRESITAARVAVGRKPVDRRYPLGCGAALGLAGWALIGGLLNGAAATAAEQQAAERFGPEYRYRTIGLRGFSFGDDSVSVATVAMWNDKELKILDGAWSAR